MYTNHLMVTGTFNKAHMYTQSKPGPNVFAPTRLIWVSLGDSGGEGGEVSGGGRQVAPLPLQNGLNPQGIEVANFGTTYPPNATKVPQATFFLCPSCMP